MPTQVAIITSAHWEGDPRLNRHVAYLESGGYETMLESFAGKSRFLAVLGSIRAILTTSAQFVILPDPELFLICSVVARLSGRRPIIDIHEDYRRAAAGREWIPRLLRPLAGASVGTLVALGRLSAWKVVVAAPELARKHDSIVLNIPDPGSIVFRPDSSSRTLVYVGDVTMVRGAVEMVKTLALLDSSFDLVVIGRVEDAARKAMVQEARRAELGDRLHLVGRIPHDQAWQRAADALVGLCLLQPLPAYRDAVATKIWEYLASGLIPVVSDLPGQARLVGRIDPELVCGSAEEAAAIVTKLGDDPQRRRDLASRGRTLVERAWADSRPDLALQATFAP